MPKYIYNGEEYSVQDLVQAAEASNLTVEDYILNAGIEVVEDESFQTGPVKETAVAGPMTEAQQQAVDTVSVLEDTSLGSPEVDGKLEFPYEADYADQLKAYEKKYNDSLSASNGYEYLQDKPLEEREFIASRFAIAPTRTIRILNEETQKYEEKARPDALEAVKKEMPTNFADYNTPQEFNVAVNQTIAKSLENDPLINFEINKSIELNKPKIEAKKRTKVLKIFLQQFKSEI